MRGFRSAFAGSLVLLGAAIVVPAVRFADVTADAPAGTTVRAIIPMTARDGLQPESDLPQPDPSYCAPADPSSAPPNSIIGNLHVAGAPAPTGTIAQVFFDGKAGPARRSTQAGGYRVDYAAGGSGCANQVGAEISIMVNGQLFDSGVKVGDPAANPFLLFDITVP